MKIVYKEGNVFHDTNVKVVMHGCNSHGVMGGGIAREIRERYPLAYNDYRNVYNSRGLDLGEVIISEQPDGMVILNAITQKDFGSDPNVVYVSYWAIAETLRKIDRMGYQYVAMPKIGAGLANGDWNVIEAIIENTFTKTQPFVYVI